MSQLLVTDLHKIAGGLNIEGGYPAKDLKKKNALWANLVIVLDRPLIDNIIFDDILTNNKYPLLENALDDLNEHQFLASYIMIIAYYINHGRKMLNYSLNDALNITVHIHQDIACSPLIDYIKEYLSLLVTDFSIDLTNIHIEYITDNTHYLKTITNYDKTDILISLSQCAGLSPDLPVGALIIPNEFIPYDIDSKMINGDHQYSVVNDLNRIIENILNSPYHQYAVNLINQKYQSHNPSKNGRHSASMMVNNNFVVTKILQVSKLWNPVDRTEMIKINI